MLSSEIKKKDIRLLDVMYWLSLICAYLFVLFFLAMLQMDYDDNYVSSKGEYWSLRSMNTKQQISYFLYIAWILFSIVGLTYFVRNIIRRIKFDT